MVRSGTWVAGIGVFEASWHSNAMRESRASGSRIYARGGMLPHENFTAEASPQSRLLTSERRNMVEDMGCLALYSLAFGKARGLKSPQFRICHGVERAGGENII